jgi:hypothetical protein
MRNLKFWFLCRILDFTKKLHNHHHILFICIAFLDPGSKSYCVMSNIYISWRLVEQ